MRPSVRLDRRDTRGDFGIGREDLTELAPKGSLALDVGEAVRRGVVLGLIQEGAGSAERHVDDRYARSLVREIEAE